MLKGLGGLGGLGDMAKMMKAAKDMQGKLAEVQEELKTTEVSGTSGGGLVTVRATASGQIRGVEIDPSLIKSEDKEVLEDLIVAAIADAQAAGAKLSSEEMAKLTEGLGLPPGFSLPF
ncbi:MAG: YbaB/EbfC family nucleoid-associated protein [Deltaproteobacteria bacterium]